MPDHTANSAPAHDHAPGPSHAQAVFSRDLATVFAAWLAPLSLITLLMLCGGAAACFALTRLALGVLSTLFGHAAETGGLSEDNQTVGTLAPLQTENSSITLLEPGLLFFTLFAALVIGTLATILAWPIAWSIRTSRARLAPFALAPLLLPSFVTYAGWSLLRAPGMPLGNLLEHAAESGFTSLPTLAGRWIALLSLAAWSSPLAALVLSLHLSRLETDTLWMLRLDGCSHVQNLLQRLRMTWRGLLAATLAVALLMIGSAIPLHVAQVDTYAIRLWLAMDLLPLREQWRAWLAAWPLILIAMLAGLVIARRAMEPIAHSSQPSNAPRPPRTAVWFPAALLAILVLLPLVLLAHSLRSLASAADTWNVLLDALPSLAQSSAIAAGVGLISVAITLLAWFSLSRGGVPRRVTAAAVPAMTAIGLLPGMLVGSWFNTGLASLGTLWPSLDPLRDQPAILIPVHAARLGFLSLLVATQLDRLEPRDEHDQRTLDDGRGIRTFLSIALRWGWPGVLGVGLASAILSLQEIEASVLVQPPGSPSLARLMLGYLHFARLLELSALSLWLVALGTPAAVMASWLIARVRR